MKDVLHYFKSTVNSDKWVFRLQLEVQPPDVEDSSEYTA